MADKQHLAVHQRPPQSPPESTPNGFSATPPIPPPTHGPEWSHSFWDCCSPTETCIVPSITMSVSCIANEQITRSLRLVSALLSLRQNRVASERPSPKRGFRCQRRCNSLPPTPSFYVNPITRQNTDPDRLVLHLLPLHLLRPLRDRAHAEARRAAQALRDRGLRAEGLRRLVFLSVLHARAAREGGRGPVRHYAGAVSVAGGDGFFAVGKKFGGSLVLLCRGSRFVRSFPLLLYSMCIDNLNRITYYRPALYFSCSKWEILLNISSCILYKHYF